MKLQASLLCLAIASALSVTMDFVEKNGVALIREELGQENS